MQERFYNELIKRLCLLPAKQVVNAHNDMCDIAYDYLFIHEMNNIKYEIKNLQFIENMDDFNPNDKYYQITVDDELISFTRMPQEIAENLALSMITLGDTFNINDPIVKRIVHELHKSGYRG